MPKYVRLHGAVVIMMAAFRLVRDVILVLAPGATNPSYAPICVQDPGG